MTEKPVAHIEVISTGKIGAKIAVYFDDESKPLVVNLTSRDYRATAFSDLRGDILQIHRAEVRRYIPRLDA